MKQSIQNNDNAVSPVIAVILMVAIAVVLSGVLWAMLSNMGTPDIAGSDTVLTTRRNSKGESGWEITIESINNRLALDDVTFLLVDKDRIVLWQANSGQALPPPFLKGGSTIHAIPCTPGTPVRDGKTNDTVTNITAFMDYELCYMAFLDSDSDGKVTSTDAIWIFKDYNSDGTPDLSPGYTLEIRDDNNKLIGSSDL